MPVVHGDFETRSVLDLKKVGIARYVEHPTTGIWLLRFRFDSGPVSAWAPGDPDPEDLLKHVASRGTFVGHHVAFERWIWNKVLRTRYCPHWPSMTIEQTNCTMARGYALSLPGDLDRVAKILNCPHQKDAAGKDNMLRMAKPKKVFDDGRVVWHDDAPRIKKLGSYCDDDVLTESDIDERAPQLSTSEQILYHFDQYINDRGVGFDADLAFILQEVCAVATERGNARLKQLTNGQIEKYTQVQQIKDWLGFRGLEADRLRKDAIEELQLEARSRGDETAWEVLEIRRQCAKASTSKLAAGLRSVCADGRVRHMLGFHVASTGRWAGRILQPHNLPRVDPDSEMPVVQEITQLALSGKLSPTELHDYIALAHGPVMPWISKCVRSTIVAGAGNKLVGGDLSNIEGRVNAWLAGETWKLKAFADFDAGVGPDLYLLAYANSFGVPVEAVTKAQRQIGKVQELALGFQGSVGALLSMCETYGMDPFEMAKAVRDVVPEHIWQKTFEDYTPGDSYGLDSFTWTGLKIIVDGFRKANSKIVQGWWDLQDAAIEAVLNEGRVVPIYGGRCAYLYSDGFLWCQLPSGRLLAYCSPSVQWRNRRGRKQRVVVFWGIDTRPGKSKAWSQLSLYGGLQCENIVQATARDIIACCMWEVELGGYPVVLHVHDENLSEVAKSFGSAVEYKMLMERGIRKQKCYDGLPIACKTWEDIRFEK